ncbi:hypothetical protein TIFTF001_004697 [Ficus carica]|uniref:Uncharacterized protein n=1 Tax=Ficus carica TaxID=3494 RepID=A0AA88CYC0_FICCA|nr:hypothetical protein TIFTF001_004697 [Ficus carica]
MRWWGLIARGRVHWRSQGRGLLARSREGEGGFLPEVSRRAGDNFVGGGDSRVGNRGGWPNPNREWVKGD